MSKFVKISYTTLAENVPREISKLLSGVADRLQETRDISLIVSERINEQVTNLSWHDLHHFKDQLDKASNKISELESQYRDIQDILDGYIVFLNEEAKSRENKLDNNT